MTHAPPGGDARPALRRARRVAAAARRQLRARPRGDRQVRPRRRVAGIEIDAPARRDVQLCVTLGGDGTILRALRAYARTRCRCSASTSARSASSLRSSRRHARGLRARPRRPARARKLPALESTPPAAHTAVNDLALHAASAAASPSSSYAVGGEEVGSVRCDGLVVATPAGSTGYNLANGGPVMAWGAAGMVVSFIAPHSLSARALVIAPDDVLTIHNSSREALALVVDGRPIGEIAPDEVVRVASPTASRR